MSGHPSFITHAEGCIFWLSLGRGNPVPGRTTFIPEREWEKHSEHTGLLTVEEFVGKIQCQDYDFGEYHISPASMDLVPEDQRHLFQHHPAYHVQLMGSGGWNENRLANLRNDANVVEVPHYTERVEYHVEYIKDVVWRTRASFTYPTMQRARITRKRLWHELGLNARVRPIVPCPDFDPDGNPNYYCTVCIHRTTCKR